MKGDLNNIFGKLEMLELSQDSEHKVNKFITIQNQGGFQPGTWLW